LPSASRPNWLECGSETLKSRLGCLSVGRRGRIARRSRRWADIAEEESDRLRPWFPLSWLSLRSARSLLDGWLRRLSPASQRERRSAAALGGMALLPTASGGRACCHSSSLARCYHGGRGLADLAAARRHEASLAEARCCQAVLLQQGAAPPP
jgi:hypothetical protein